MPRDIALAALFLIALHLLGRPAQGGAGERGLTLVDLFLRPRQSAADDVVEIGFHRPSGDLLFVNLDGVLDRLFHAVEIERFVARDALGHFPDEALGDVALARRLLGIVLDQQIEDRGIGDMLGEIVRILELAAGIAMNRLQPREMGRLRGARVIGWLVTRPAPSARVAALAIISGFL